MNKNLDKTTNAQRSSKIDRSEVKEDLTGSCERVTFHNAENGFCVLRVNVRGQRELVTVVGSIANISAGEVIEAHGSWHQDRQHGLQFKAEHLSTAMPHTLDGMEKYLASGMVQGIGPVFAKRLIKAFGMDVFSIIEKSPEKLGKLEGIGKQRIARLCQTWGEQKVVRQVMVFLQSHGVGTGRAVRIYKTYGDKAVSVVEENPYRLAVDIRGIGFKTADKIAQSLGVDPHSLKRAAAGVRHVMQTIAANGHCAAMLDDLCSQAVKLLEIPLHVIEEAIESEILQQNLVRTIKDEKPCIYLTALYKAESGAAEQIARLLQHKSLPWKKINHTVEIPNIELRTGIKLSESQQQAVITALQSKVMVITGGPGVGKTTIVNSILKIVQSKGVEVALCAPTGRAAKRMHETTGVPAKTIHRLLEFDPATFAFKHGVEKPLAADFIIVDEVSMLDINLAYNLLKAIPTHAALLLVGDVDQLPSVGPGSFLADVLNSKCIPAVYLTEIFRQASSSQIITNAHLINTGEIPIPISKKSDLVDFYYMEEELVDVMQAKLIKMVTERIPQRFSVDPIKDIQVLVPMHNGALGSRALNALLQERLNGGSEPKIQRFGVNYAPGDKVIQLVNNYKKEVFNGDLGVINSIDLEEQLVYINFEDRKIEYEFSELDEISLAYATTIHKSQGSEYPVVVIPLATQHYMLLARNLLYTGVTRGKQLVVLIGQRKAVRIAVKNSNHQPRLSSLVEQLQRYIIAAG